MKYFLTQILPRKTFAAFMMVAILGVSTPISVSAALAVDAKADGQDSLALTSTSTPFTITLATTDASTCIQTSPVSIGVATTLNMVVSFGMPDFPADGGSTTFTFECEDATSAGTFLTDSVVVSLNLPGTPTTPTVDVQVNGSNGPVTINNGDSYSYTWTSSNVTTCDQTSPVSTGLSLTGSSTVNPGDANFYPSTTTPITIAITCTDGTTSVSDSVTVSIGVVPPGGGGAPTIDVKVNGSDGPVNLVNGNPINLSWTSSNVTTCDQTSPVSTGLSLTGTSTITPGLPDYPAVGSSVTFTITCSNGTTNVIDSVTVNIISGGSTGGSTPPSSGGGGGGGGRSTPAPSVQCPWINSYMRIDFNNDPIEVMKLQSFLKVFMGYDYVQINGVFDQATYDAVGVFQALYSNEILAPWGHTAPTHYVYILTLKKVNEIYCQNISVLTADQLAEITAFRIALQAAQRENVPVFFTPGGEIPESATTSPIDLPIVGSADPQGQNLRALAAAIFTLPDNLKDTLWSLYEFILILLVLYALGIVLKDVLYEDTPANTNKRFFVKWVTIAVGLVVAIFMVLLLGMLHLILPLLIALIFSIIWMIFKRSSRASIKSWFIVLKARIKAFSNKTSN